MISEYTTKVTRDVNYEVHGDPAGEREEHGGEEHGGVPVRRLVFVTRQLDRWTPTCEATAFCIQVRTYTAIQTMRE